MTDQAQATRVTPAGWYQDPAASDRVRWWNGLTWTDHTEAKPDESAQRVAEARKLEREFGISTAENAIMSAAAAPAGSAASAATAPHAQATTTSRTANTGTAGVWLLAFMPVFTLVIAAAAAYVYVYVAATPLVAIAAVVVWLLGLLWAVSDSRALESRGIDAPKPRWALIGALVYLVLRRAKVPNVAPIAVFLILTVVAGGGLLVGALSPAGAPVRTALNIQTTLHHELVETGQLSSVSCPVIVESANPGELVTCTGAAPDGTARTIWVSFDDTSGGFSYAIDIR